MEGIPQKMSQLKDKEELEDGINRKDDTIVIFKNILVISYKIYGVRLTLNRKSLREREGSSATMSLTPKWIWGKAADIEVRPRDNCSLS